METRQRNNTGKSEEWKVFVDASGTKCANLKDKLLFYVFCGFPYYLDGEKVQHASENIIGPRKSRFNI